jgi:hypothetical protein
MECNEQNVLYWTGYLKRLCTPKKCTTWHPLLPIGIISQIYFTDTLISDSCRNALEDLLVVGTPLKTSSCFYKACVFSWRKLSTEHYAASPHTGNAILNAIMTRLLVMDYLGHLIPPDISPLRLLFVLVSEKQCAQTTPTQSLNWSKKCHLLSWESFEAPSKVADSFHTLCAYSWIFFFLHWTCHPLTHPPKSYCANYHRHVLGHA